MTISIPLFKVLMDMPAVIEKVSEVGTSGLVTEGPRVMEFEAKLGEILGASMLTVNSGTSALHLAALALGIKPGDEVISTPITCAATNLALLHAGAKIVWADVDPRTGMLDPEDVIRKVTSSTKAVMVVEWGGRPADIAALRRSGCPIIVDAAHSFGVQRDEWADATCWSFQAIKHLTCGDGGAIALRDYSRHELVRRLRWFGIDRRAPGPNIDKPIHEAGFKYHMNDLDASIGLANLPAATRAMEKHREHASYFHRELAGIAGIALPPVCPRSAWWLYTLVLDPERQREGFVEYMRKAGIETSQVHRRNDLQPVFSGMRSAEMPGVEHFDRNQVAIPVGWWLSDADLRHVVETIRAWSATPG